MKQLNNNINSNFLQVVNATLCNKNPEALKAVGHMYLASQAGGEMKQKIVSSVAELRRGADEQYVTANTFFLPRWGRNKKNLRYLNAIVLDFDVTGAALDVHEIVIKIADAGLPPANMVVRTPSGGMHGWWFLRPVPGTPRAVRLYEALQMSMAAALGADPAAVGAERLWRMPRAADVIYSSSKKHRLKALRSWRDEHRPEDKPAGEKVGQVYADSRGLLQHSAVQQLLRGVRKGQRDNACFALAAAHLCSGYSAAETEQLLQRWNELNAPALPVAAVTKCVKSAETGLKKDYLHYYNAMRAKIREITGISIKYRPITPRKPREERKRTHLDEHEQDIIDLLQKRGGKLLITQSRLAKTLNAPGRSTKAALARLVRSKAVIKLVIMRGRRSVTVLIAKIFQHWKKQMVHSRIHVSSTNFPCPRGGAVVVIPPSCLQQLE